MARLRWVALLVGCAGEVEPAADPHAAGGACAGCHPAAAAAWAGSRHAAAQGAIEGEAGHLARFDGVDRAVGSLRATPTLSGGRPEFEVADGAGRRRLPVVGVIGVEPLQQYLLDGGGGARVVAPLAWDVARGGWFDPAPGGAVGRPDDPMRWDGLAGIWNHQCAACHTTGFEKNYDPITRQYQSASTHGAVACDACHGSPTAPRALRAADAQLDACAGCHSRRQPLTCGGSPARLSSTAFLDHYQPALMDSGAFLPDGRGAAPDEPFEWAPWAQSRMAAAGVRCTDCHDPHSGAMLRPGDATCTGCHADLSEAEPHPTSGCVSCHMATATYMGVDERHDHSFRRPGDQRQAAIFSLALAGDLAAIPGLVAIAADPAANAFDRASALTLLRRSPPTDLAALRPYARDPSALVRAAAVGTLGRWGDVGAAREGLSDPVRAVRFAAIEAYVLGGGDVRAAPAFLSVLAEVEALGACEDDLPSTHQNLGRLRASVGDREGAIRAFEQLLRLSPADPTALYALRLLRGGG